MTRLLRLAAAVCALTATVSACSNDANVPPKGGVPASSALAPIHATPSTLVFTALGSAAVQVVTLSESGYTGAFSLVTACTITSETVITQTSYAVTPLANGSCTLTFFDSNGQRLDVPVTVSSGTPTVPTPAPSANPGQNPIVASPISLAFFGVGSGLAQTVSLSEQGYSGAFALKSTCSQVSVTQSTPTVFSVAPLSAGSCALLFGDTNGGSVLVPAVVTVTNGSGE